MWSTQYFLFIFLILNFWLASLVVVMDRSKAVLWLKWWMCSLIIYCALHGCRTFTKADRLIHSLQTKRCLFQQRPPACIPCMCTLRAAAREKHLVQSVAECVAHLPFNELNSFIHSECPQPHPLDLLSLFCN